MTDCLFCRIAAGEIPAHVIHEDELTVAFLDIHPIREGHALVVPRDHHVWFEDMPPELAAHVTHVCQRLARRMKSVWKVERVAQFYTGIHVPHVHAHVLPMHHIHDLTSVQYMADGPDGFSAPPTPPDADLRRAADLLRGA